jgi:hypothetical protein
MRRTMPAATPFVESKRPPRPRCVCYIIPESFGGRADSQGLMNLLLTLKQAGEHFVKRRAHQVLRLNDGRNDLRLVGVADGPFFDRIL